MDFVDQLIDRFEKENYAWYGDVSFPFWNDEQVETFINIDSDRTDPSPWQKDTLRALCEFPRNVRPRFEAAVVHEYERHIYGSVADFGKSDQWEELTPKLKQPSDIWQLVSAPAIIIPIDDDQSSAKIRFRISFSWCQWDEEHGFGAAVEDWRIVGFGGEID